MNDRIILHSDMNSFYVSVEVMQNPILRGKAVAVGGDTEERRGIILAKSQKAKEAGVKTGMANWEARRICPDLIVIPPHYDQYLKYSKLARTIYERYTDLIEPFGMDECWLDVTGRGRRMDDGYKIAEEIRSAIKGELGITVSVGVSFNKIFAKLGSDMKKPDAVTVITKDNFKEKVWPLPAGELLYVGPATVKKLAKRGVTTIGKLAQTPPDIIRHWLGEAGLKLHAFAAGEDTSRVMHKDFSAVIKSIGHGLTFTRDVSSPEEIRRLMLELSQDVGHRLRENRLFATGIQIFIRGEKLDYAQFQAKLPFKTQLPRDIANAAYREFVKRYSWESTVRAVSLRAINLVGENYPDQLTLFTDTDKMESLEQVEESIEEIRSRFGKNAITYASLLTDLPLPRDKRELVKMPSLMFS